MPTSLNITGSRSNPANAVLQKVESMSSDEAKAILQQLKTQIQTRGGGVKSGVLTLVNLNNPEQTVRFERKSWYQFRARSADRVSVTARVIEALIDKAGLTSTADRRDFAGYLEQRANRVGTEKLDNRLRRMDLSASPADPTHREVTTALVRTHLKDSGLRQFATYPEERLEEVARGLRNDDLRELFRLLKNPGHLAYGESDPLGHESLTKMAEVFLGRDAQPAVLARFSAQAFSVIVEQPVVDIDDYDQSQHLAPPIDPLARLATHMAIRLLGTGKDSLPKIETFTQSLHKQLDLEAMNAEGVQGVGRLLSDDARKRVGQRHMQLRDALIDAVNSRTSGLSVSEEERLELGKTLGRSVETLRNASSLIDAAPRGEKGRSQLNAPASDGYQFHEVRGLDVRGGHINGGYFSGGLRDATFHQVDLRGLDTSDNLEIDRVTFSQCDLTGAKLRFRLDYPQSLLSEVSFRGSDLTGASISIDYESLKDIPADAPNGAHESIFNHLSKEHRTSPLTMIDSIPNRFLGLKTKLMREAIEHLHSNGLTDKLQAPLADIIRGNRAYLEDPYIRKTLGPQLLGDSSFPAADRRALGLKMLNDLHKQSEPERSRFVRNNIPTVNLMLLQEYLEPAADPANAEAVQKRDALMAAAADIEAIVHRSMGDLCSALKGATVFDEEWYKPEAIKNAPQVKGEYLLMFPAGDNLAATVSYDEFAKLVETPNDEAFSRLNPIKRVGDDWKMGGGEITKDDRLRVIRTVPYLSQRYDAMKPSPALVALRLALGDSAALEQTIAPGLNGLGTGVPPAEVDHEIKPSIENLYVGTDNMYRVEAAAPGRIGARAVQLWENARLSPKYLDNLKEQARGEGVDVDSPRQWALYLLNVSISIARLGSNAVLGSHNESVNSLRFHAFHLMEAAKTTDPSLVPSGVWNDWASHFKDTGSCAEVLSREMLTRSKSVDPVMFERVIPAQFRVAA